MKLADSGLRPHRPSRRALLRIGAAGVVGVAIAGIALVWRAPPASSAGGHRAEAEDFYADICTAVPAQAAVGANVTADLQRVIGVPASTPEIPFLDADASAPIRVRRGEVVELRIESPREGAVGVHGLSEIARIQAGQAILLRFRAIYEGRFPVHFHGRDKSHFEIAVLEIRGEPGRA